MVETTSDEEWLTLSDEKSIGLFSVKEIRPAEIRKSS